MLKILNTTILSSLLFLSANTQAGFSHNEIDNNIKSINISSPLGDLDNGYCKQDVYASTTMSNGEKVYWENKNGEWQEKETSVIDTSGIAQNTLLINEGEKAIIGVKGYPYLLKIPTCR